MDLRSANPLQARLIRLRGIVQGVGMRPTIFRYATGRGLAGWVRNGLDGVEIVAEGGAEALAAFLNDLRERPPAAAQISTIEVEEREPAGLGGFRILDSGGGDVPATRVSPDLAICEDCRRELFDPGDRRHLYPYINCTNCGPRYSILLGLPYDRCRTTMAAWPLDAYCAGQYEDPADRRFHAQPVACGTCGPDYVLRHGDAEARGAAAIAGAARLLGDGAIVAVKGIGGYHLACDARNAAAVLALRERKFRKEKPFALLVPDVETARELVVLEEPAEELLRAVMRPIVIAPGREELAHVAPGNHELGVMLPYTPLHYLLFHYGAPRVSVLTSANRSDEPIAYRDEDALEQLTGIADAFLVGERPIARRIDDSVVRASVGGAMILRRARGYAPGAVASLPRKQPILAVGADLKNTITLCVNGEAFGSQHIGDLEHYPAREAFEQTVADLMAMYRVRMEETLVVHDLHPEYHSTRFAVGLRGSSVVAVPHHRAHVASVLGERQAWGTRVVGVSCDGTGYGEDGSIWGCEFFAGSLEAGLRRVASLRQAALPGGDAAARYPVQAAAGFLAGLDGLPDLGGEPFGFADRYRRASEMVARGVRTFPTTSMGRLFDTAAALVGFVRECSFEGQAAIWLEQLARGCGGTEGYPFPERDWALDYEPLLRAVVEDVRRGRERAEVAWAFHRGVAQGLARMAARLCETEGVATVALSGGVFQNQVLLRAVTEQLTGNGLTVWVNRQVPPNDGGISLGQAVLAAFVRDGV